ncbi:nucleotide exchange factor GrpE [Mycolicibacterium lacusdiani]|uniref:nucleotide exchange factor GrpE n=1 Tax=Mycolicibacterium lacusdiani TaxID=2895283 RepID=UPI001F24F8E7|nr:nucleotide exchange factor GrpE [Mycolicibacterium lacusdiani]
MTITDKRRIDPDTGEVREAGPGGQERSDRGDSTGPAPSGSEPGAGTPAPADTDEAAELKAMLQRVKAEYDNYRKRADREKQVAAERGKATAIVALLPVLDDLDRARKHGDLETSPLKSVSDKLAGTLESMGLVAFGVEGDPFDPSLHEAVQHEGDGSNPVLGTVMRQGYKLGDQVLRNAMVGVVDGVDGADTAVKSDAAAQDGSESSE